jgi:hypothetical protein
MFMVTLVLKVNVPGGPSLCIIEVTIESFTVAASQLSAMVSLVYLRESDIEKCFSRLVAYW